jgi:hypothetical protein
MTNINNLTDVDDISAVDRSRETFESFYMTLDESNRSDLYRTTKPFRGVQIGDYKWIVTRSMYVGWQAAEQVRQAEVNEYGHYYYNAETEQTGIVFGCHVANGFFESHPECEDMGPVVVERVLESD